MGHSQTLPPMRWLMALAHLPLVVVAMHLGLTTSSADEVPQAKVPSARVTHGRYLAELTTAELRAEQATDVNPPGVFAVSVEQDLLAIVRAAVGEYEGAKEAMRDGQMFQAAPPVTEEQKRSLFAATRIDAVQAIVEEAKDRQVVIINEAHHIPETRHLTRELLVRLEPLGFRYFACEAFGPTIRGYDTAGYPAHQNCPGYLREPVYADVVRQARSLGYELVPYEQELSVAASLSRFAKRGSGLFGGAQAQPTLEEAMHQIREREIKQAANLIARVFEDDEDARVLIHCGYAHARESWPDDDERDTAWMAARLARAREIDPLTIDQTHQRQTTSVEASSPLWRFATGQGLVPRPTVFRHQDGIYLVEGRAWAGHVDMQVFHPRTRRRHGRPGWLSMDGYRQPVSLPADVKPPNDTRVLVQVFLDREGDDAIPMDQVLWIPDQPAPTLMLPKGNYRILVQNVLGSEVVRSSVSVE